MWEILIGIRLLGRNPRQCLSFIRSLALPVIAMISILGLISGLSSEIVLVSSSMRDSDTALIYQKDNPALHTSTINWTIVQQIQQQPQVKEVFPHQLAIASISDPLSGREIQIEVFGLNLSQIIQFNPKVYLAKGTFASESRFNECMIGSWLAEKLHIEKTYPAKITLQAETILNANVTGMLENAGRYAGAIVTSLEFFETLFPSRSAYLSFVELRFHRSVRAEEGVKSIQAALNKEGYSYEVIAEHGQKMISKQILSDILTIFWVFAIAAFVVIALQVHFATKWLGLHFIDEFRILRGLGVNQRELTLTLLFMALFLGNIAFAIAVLIGLPLGTASLAFLTLFSGTSRFYAGIQLFDLFLLLILANLTTFLGSFYQAWDFGMKKNLTLGTSG